MNTSSPKTKIGKHLVAFAGENRANLRLDIHLQYDDGLVGQHPQDHHFCIFLPGQEGEIEIAYRGGDGTIAPFYVREPDNVVCQCGDKISTLIQMYGSNWYTKHLRQCEMCHTPAAYHYGLHPRCDACGGTGVVRTVQVNYREQSMAE